MRKRVKICLVTASFSVLLLASFTARVQATPIVQDVAFIDMEGFASETTPFVIDNAGIYVATLIDDVFPEAFDFLGLTVNNASENFALLFSPGTMQFNVGESQTGPFEATAVWDTGNNSHMGQYRWSIAAIPEPTSMILLGSGLMGLAVLKSGRRKLQD